MLFYLKKQVKFLLTFLLTFKIAMCKKHIGQFMNIRMK